MPSSGDLKKKLESILEVISEIDSPVAALRNAHQIKDLIGRKPEHSSLKQVGENFVNTVKQDVENARERITNVQQKERTKTSVIHFLILSLIPLLAIVIGGINLNNCPVNSNIPSWLLVFGIVAIAKNVLTLLIEIWASDSLKPKLSIIKGILSVVLFIWFLIGLSYVWKTWGEYSGDSLMQNYCDNLTMIYCRIVVVLILLCYGVFLILALIRGCLYLKDRFRK